MPWVKVDDHYTLNRKMRRAGMTGRWFHFCAFVYAARELLDGRIERSDFDALAYESQLSVEQIEECVERLVEVGAFDVVEDGVWMVHDFTEYQPSRAEVEAGRRRWAEQRAARRAKRREMIESARNDVSAGLSPPDTTADAHADTTADTEPAVGAGMTAGDRNDTSFLNEMTRDDVSGGVSACPVPVPGPVPVLPSEVENDLVGTSVPTTQSKAAMKRAFEAEFDEFWDVWPGSRRTAKAQCKAKYVRWAEDLPPRAIIDAAKRWVAYWNATKTESSYIPLTQTWINQQRWEQEVPSPVEQKPMTHKERMAALRRQT